MMIKAHGYRFSLLLGALVLGGLVGCGQEGPTGKAGAGFRKGDNAPLALVSLMDRVERTAEPAQEKNSKSEETKAAKTA